MRFRPAGSQRPLLFAGGVFSLLALFQGTVQRALNIPGGPAAGLSLLPALLILLLALLFRWKLEAEIRHLRAAADLNDAEAARSRDQELERLLLFGATLAGSLSLEELREATARHLPRLIQRGDVWAVVRNGGGSDRLLDVACTRWRRGEIERIAEAVAALPHVGRSSADGIACEGHLCFAMLAGSRCIGVIGVAAADLTPELRRSLAAATALLMVAVHHSQLFAEVRDNGVKDGLTGCYNRTHALQMLDNELARSRRTGSPLSLVLIDVDSFKQINDRCGHLAGDAVLDTLGEHLRRILRRTDVRCRYGGDEFLLVLPETPAAGAARLVETLRAEIERSVAPTTSDGEQLPVSISAGVTSTAGGEASAHELIARADRALYHAKAAGRNCVRVQASAGGAVTPPPTMLRPIPPELDDEEWNVSILAPS